MNFSFARLAVVALLATGPLACSPSSPTGGGGDGGGNELTGTAAFPVHDAVIDTQTPKAECGYESALAGGGYGSVVLWLSDQPLGATDGGSPGNSPPTSAHLLRIELAGPSYAGGNSPPAGGAVAAMGAGTYAISFEAQNDEDLCMLTPGGAAVLDVFDIGTDAASYTQATAASGTVTLSTVTTGHMVGSFDVQLSTSPFTATGL
ncbi:MAG TPA: hypothetical protein VGI39_36950, partial [Polyangiaceae bacterium]